MRQGQHRRQNEPLKERLLRLIVPTAQREKPDTDHGVVDDASPRGRHAVRAHDTAA